MNDAKASSQIALVSYEIFWNLGHPLRSYHLLAAKNGDLCAQDAHERRPHRRRKQTFMA